MKVKIKWLYKGAKTASIQFESDWISEDAFDRSIDDIYNTGRVIDLTIVDEMGAEWTKKEYLKLREEIKNEPSDCTIFFDGGFDREKRIAGIGMVVYYKIGNEAYRYRQNAKIEEIHTNNEAEYIALYNSLSLLEEIGAHHIPCIIKGDSQGVLKQLSGEWPCFEKVLNDWLDRIEHKMEKLGINPTFIPISRKENKEADQLASQALNDKIISSHLKIS
ncbi:reverse transcriptase-like protein [Bacillus sp. FJAT-49736]|uniref:reverse transcriptase-like protein n=1 Tax=Bacillus sp. FJAT-49736 TaxID=2833582 RepID=UPI001BC96D3E|nr:reverse transcriptase-like protein [Bacillus sp. FJAT-49736]MBS4173212.1 reverse transcriptase-like protein [Bacillus sp. FJAT-49736]